MTFSNLLDFIRELGSCVNEIRGGCKKGVTKGIADGVQVMLAGKRWKDRTGETRKATRSRLVLVTREGAEGIMECAIDRASYLNSGTVPHDIRPKEGYKFIGPLKSGQSRRKKTDIGTHRVALRWYNAGGQPVFAAVVHHPGTKGDGFFDLGVERCKQVIIHEVNESVDRAQTILDR